MVAEKVSLEDLTQLAVDIRNLSEVDRDLRTCIHKFLEERLDVPAVRAIMAIDRLVSEAPLDEGPARRFLMAFRHGLEAVSCEYVEEFVSETADYLTEMIDANVERDSWSTMLKFLRTNGVPEEVTHPDDDDDEDDGDDDEG